MRGEEVVSAIAADGGDARAFHRRGPHRARGREPPRRRGRRCRHPGQQRRRFPFGATHELDEGTFDVTFDLNVKSPFFLTAKLAPRMAAEGGGAIINVSTMVPDCGMAGMSAYKAPRLRRTSSPRLGPPSTVRWASASTRCHVGQPVHQAAPPIREDLDRLCVDPAVGASRRCRGDRRGDPLPGFRRRQLHQRRYRSRRRRSHRRLRLGRSRAVTPGPPAHPGGPPSSGHQQRRVLAGATGLASSQATMLAASSRNSSVGSPLTTSPPRSAHQSSASRQSPVASRMTAHASSCAPARRVPHEKDERAQPLRGVSGAAPSGPKTYTRHPDGDRTPR